MDVVSKVAPGYVFKIYFILLYFIIFNLQIWLIHRLKVQVTISIGQEP